MTQNLVLERTLQFLACRIEQCKLLGREVVEIVAVGANEMAEYRSWDDGILMFQSVDELVDILFGVESQTVHAGVELDMYRESCYTLFPCGSDESIE